MEPITNAQYNRLVDSLTIPQINLLQDTCYKIALSANLDITSRYPVMWMNVDIETFLQIAYAAIVVCGFSLPD